MRLPTRPDVVVTGRIATLAGREGFGWVEAIAIGGGRVVASGSRAEIEELAVGPLRRLDVGPDRVVLPGLTDAHLHVLDTATAAQQVELTTAPTLEDGLRSIAIGNARLSHEDAWLEGAGWDADRWGRWPTSEDLELVAPGRRAIFWAHDHHALWASRAALRTAGIDASTPDPPGGVIRRAPDGSPAGCLHERAASLVVRHVPQRDDESIEAALLSMAQDLLSLGVVAVHDPGELAPDVELRRSFAAYGRLAARGELPIGVHVSLRQEALAAAIERGLRSGMSLDGPHVEGARSAGDRSDRANRVDRSDRAIIGWLKLFADGTLGSRTAALLEPYEGEADGQIPPGGGGRGIFATPPDVLADLSGRAAAAGIVTQIHAIGDAAVRAALDALAPTVPGSRLMPRIEHIQLIHPDDVTRFRSLGVAASVQPIHLRADAAPALRAWGRRADRFGYAWAALARAEAVLAFGTDAPVEPIDPWPGLALAATRRDPSWPAEMDTFGPSEVLPLDRALRSACLDPALVAREPDRGRLMPGHRADLIVMPAEIVDTPVEPDGPLSTARPELVLVDGSVAFER